jgi:hypothetical protein
MIDQLQIIYALTWVAMAKMQSFCFYYVIIFLAGKNGAVPHGQNN